MFDFQWAGNTTTLLTTRVLIGYGSNVAHASPATQDQQSRRYRYEPNHVVLRKRRERKTKAAFKSKSKREYKRRDAAQLFIPLRIICKETRVKILMRIMSPSVALVGCCCCWWCGASVHALPLAQGTQCLPSYLLISPSSMAMCCFCATRVTLVPCPNGDDGPAIAVHHMVNACTSYICIMIRVKLTAPKYVTWID